MCARLGIMMLLVLVLTSCTGAPGYGASYPGKQLGVVLDQQLRVVEIESGSAAEQAGIQGGDILLDLTWIPTGTLEPLVTAVPSETLDPSMTLIPAATVIALAEDASFNALDANGTPIEGSESLSPIAIPAATIPPEQYMERATVPFTDSLRIRSLLPSGVPLNVRLQRGDQVLDLVIVPQRPVFHPLAPGDPTGTPIPETYYYY